MRVDDLVSSLKFLNRRQLLRFCKANRFTLEIVEEHFDEWPAIYCELQIVQKYIIHADEHPNVDGRCPFESYIQLKALNCDCEQQLSININELFTYKVAINCECDMKAVMEKSERNGKEHFELEAHKNCKNDWSPLEDPLSEIPPFRRKCFRVKELITSELYLHKLAEDAASRDANKCYQFFAHKVHDQPSRNSIAKEFVFRHRRQLEKERAEELKLKCPMALLLRAVYTTTSMNTLIAHLKMKFAKIYKLILKRKTIYEDDEREEQRNYADSDEIMCLQIFQWIFENKITNATSCYFDIGFIDQLLGKLIENVKMPLIDSIGKCGYLELICTNFDDEDGPFLESYLTISKVQGMLLKNASMISTGVSIYFRHFKTIENLLHCYNPQGDHRRLFIMVEAGKSFNLIALLQSFLNSINQCTYFLLIHINCERRKFKQTYYNTKTNELLRIIPANRYSLREPDDWQLVYVARYSKSATIAHEEFESFFGRVNQNVAARMKWCEEEIERQNLDKDDWSSWITTDFNYRSFGPDEDEQMIGSFSAYLANVFPNRFSLNASSRQSQYNVVERNNADRELFNAEEVTCFRATLLPPE